MLVDQILISKSAKILLSLSMVSHFYWFRFKLKKNNARKILNYRMKYLDLIKKNGFIENPRVFMVFW